MIEDELPSSEEEQKFYAAVGRAITAWAEIEDLLYAITLRILGCSRERAAIVFYRTPTIESRLSLTNDLIASFFPKYDPGEHPGPPLKRWRDLQAEIRDHLPIRNRLAHHPIGPIVDLRDDDNLQIIPASHMSSGESLRKGEVEPLVLEEIRAHRQNVLRLVNDLRNFHRQECRVPPPTSDA